MGTRVSAEAAAISREAQMRSEASEAARIAYVTQARTLRERRGSYIKMVWYCYFIKNKEELRK